MTTGGRIGFIGLGAMGSVMARRLLRAGHAVTVWARRPEAAAGLVADGAQAAASPAALARECEHVLLCVTDTAAVEAVVFGAEGVAAAGRHAGVLVDHSPRHVRWVLADAMDRMVLRQHQSNMITDFIGNY